MSHPLQNKVGPDGDITAVSMKGHWTGNRGILHGPDKVLGPARWTTKAWICCTLDWQGRRRDVMTGRKWTELFFLDEAVALAAGHRPCAYCRRTDYLRYQAAWQGKGAEKPSAPTMDAALHAARVIPRSRKKVTFDAALADLPSGVMVARDGAAHLWQDGLLYPYAPSGYQTGELVDAGQKVCVLTPRPSVRCIAQGYVPQLHHSAAPRR